MSMRYARPRTLDEALEIRSRLGADALVLAGGTDLLVGLDRSRRSTICDVSRLDELRFIDAQDGTIRLGPLASHAMLASSPLLRDLAPVIPLAAASVGSPQIRHMGTVGGNVANASPCADTVPALLACDATLTLASVRGSREIALSGFLLAPYRTALSGDEILACITLPVPPRGSRSAFIKLGRRNACAISRMNLAAIVTLDRGRIARASLAAGSVAPTAMRFADVEALLVGNEPSRDLFDEAGRLMAEKMIETSGRRWSTPYKEPVVQALTRRVLEACT
jgi:CO/xanthine dehydrogenase FAD-binding subunit